MSQIASSSTVSDRPSSVTSAVVLTLIVALGNLAFLLPVLSDDVPVGALIVGGVLGVVALPVAWALWQCRRWAMIAAIIVAAVNAIFSIPGIVFGPSVLAQVAATLGVVFCVVIIVLVRKREALASFR